MSWFMAGAAAVTAVTTYTGAQSQKSAAIKQGNAVSLAEGKAIVRERLNQTIRNSYNTGLAQMQLGLEKRRMIQQGADISAAALAAKGNADALSAASGSIGASVQAVAADINQKADSALDMTRDAFEMSVINYNNDLDAMVMNTDQSAPQPRKNEYIGPSDGALLGQSLMAGVSQFASSYAMRHMQLGLGNKPNVPSSSGGGSLSLGVSESQIASAWGYSPKF